MIFEKYDEHLFSLAIILKMCSSFIILPSKLMLYNDFKINNALWIIQKEMCMGGAQARPTSYHALPHAKE